MSAPTASAIAQDAEAGQEINLMSLPMSQLRLLQQKFTEQIEVMTREFGKLKQAYERYQNSMYSLKDLKPETKDAEIMMPLTSSIYIPAKLDNVETVLVDIGTGYMVQKTVAEADVYIRGKLGMLQSQLTSVSDTISKHQMTLQQINLALRDQMQMAYAHAQRLQESEAGAAVAE